MPRDNLAEFMASMLAKDGVWVIEPTTTHSDSYISNLLDRLRTRPARIWNPPGKSVYRFAERGAKGKWFFIWMEDE